MRMYGALGLWWALLHYARAYGVLGLGLGCARLPLGAGQVASNGHGLGVVACVALGLGGVGRFGVVGCLVACPCGLVACLMPRARAWGGCLAGALGLRGLVGVFWGCVKKCLCSAYLWCIIMVGSKVSALPPIGYLAKGKRHASLTTRASAKH